MALITMAEIRQELRVSHVVMDDILEALRDGCLKYLEGYCGSFFRDCPSYRGFTDYLKGGRRYLWPFTGPIQAVTSITNMDDASVVDPANYRAEGTRVLRLGGGHWSAPADKYELVYTAGYKQDDFPAGVKMAALQMISRVYKAPGAVGGETAFGSAINWGALLKGDIGVMLRPFVLRRPIG